MAEKGFGASQAKELMGQLVNLFKGNPSVVVNFTKEYVEVKSSGYNKGTLMLYLAELFKPEFVLCIGDDEKDEEVFQEAKSLTCSIKYSISIGQKVTCASHYLNGDEEVQRMIKDLSMK